MNLIKLLYIELWREYNNVKVLTYNVENDEIHAHFSHYDEGWTYVGSTYFKDCVAKVIKYKTFFGKEKIRIEITSIQ